MYKLSHFLFSPRICMNGLIRFCRSPNSKVISAPNFCPTGSRGNGTSCGDFVNKTRNKITTKQCKLCNGGLWLGGRESRSHALSLRLPRPEINVCTGMTLIRFAVYFLTFTRTFFSYYCLLACEESRQAGLEACISLEMGQMWKKR